MNSNSMAAYLTGGRLLARNTIWNLIGLLAPTVAGLVAVPPLIRGLGLARFGVLSLAWVVIGYFSLFDLGIGRALTKLVADKLGANEAAAIPPLVWTSMLLMLLLGILGSLIALSISPWLVHRMLNVPAPLQHETLLSFCLLAVSIPVVILTSGLRGILEAQQRFGILTLIRVPMSLFSFFGPLLVLPLSHNLASIIIILLAGRITACGAHLFACLLAMPTLHHNFSIRRSVVMPVLSFGGWMTVTNVVGPIMVYVDRFLVSALLSVGVVAYYTTPFDVVTRLLVIPAGLSGVLFPALAVSLVRNKQRTERLLSSSIKYTFLAVFPIVLVTVTLAPEGLRLWLGSSFSQNAAPVLRWLAVGVLINAIAYVPFILIQSIGRPDLIAKIEIVQAPPYLLGLWLLTTHFGIIGTGIAWTGRMVLDSIILFWCSNRLLPHPPIFLVKLSLALTGAVGTLLAATIPVGLSMRAVFLVIGLTVFAAVSWFWALGSNEKAFLISARSRALVREEC